MGASLGKEILGEGFSGEGFSGRESDGIGFNGGSEGKDFIIFFSIINIFKT